MTQQHWLSVSPRSWQLHYVIAPVACVEARQEEIEESIESGQTIINYLPVIPEDLWNKAYWLYET